MNVFRFTALSILFFSTACQAFGQDTILNKHGLWVLSSMTELAVTSQNDKNKEMVDVKKTIPSVELDLRYTTLNNFMQVQLYPALTTTFLRWPAVEALRSVQQALMKKGFGLKVYDAYRPYSITEKMWELIKDDRYAADPKKGSGHNRGIAVDLTIVDLLSGKELEMGTDFDNFSDSAHHNFQNLPAHVLQNRSMLKNLMEQNGFRPFDTEWWHYSLPNAKDFELLDIPFSALKEDR